MQDLKLGLLTDLQEKGKIWDGGGWLKSQTHPSCWRFILSHKRVRNRLYCPFEGHIGGIIVLGSLCSIEDRRLFKCVSVSRMPYQRSVCHDETKYH